MKQQAIASPFGHGSLAGEVIDGIDLDGKVVMVTGAASGIGVETARALADAGARLWMPVRDRARGETVADALRSDTGNDAIVVGEMDLFRPDTVRAFAERFLAEEDALHILVNNAGIMACPLARSPEGWESQLATNHFGHFLLTLRLLPALKAGAPSRVVNLSSIGHRLGGIDFDDPHFETRPYDKWQAYGQAKTANVLFSIGLEKRFGGAGVHAFAVHPGGIMTNLQRDLTHAEMDAMGWFDADGNPREGFKSVEGGAATSVWAATSPLLEGDGGVYCEDCNVAVPADAAGGFAGVQAHALDADAADRLWDLSLAALGEADPA
ncbi:MAG TPA: oxidoreductase [Pseudomonadales bacterium]|nr:oxidoreductase [Pseudomonadales bacterium]